MTSGTSVVNFRHIYILYSTVSIVKFWTVFCPFASLTTQKIKILKKWKKRPGDTTILNMCTINYSHMRYGSWHIKCDGQNFLSFWTMFCPFPSLTTPKIKTLKQWKKMLRDIIILHKCTRYDNHMMYGSWDMKHDRQNFLSFWTVFYPLRTRKIKILKK